MNEDHQHEQSQLFLLRVWWHLDSEGETLYHGKLQHVRSGEASAFEGWPALAGLLASMTPGPDHSDSADTHTKGDIHR